MYLNSIALLSQGLSPMGAQCPPSFKATSTWRNTLYVLRKSSIWSLPVLP